MKPEKTIVIGSDNAGNLVTILNSIRHSPHYNLTLLTASRITDILSILDNSSPDLVIAGFNDNQQVLDTLTAHTKKMALPVLCLEKKSQHTILNWDINTIVFVYPLEMAGKDFYLNNRINSIFLLKSVSPKNRLSDISTGSTDNPADVSRYVMELNRKKEILYKVKDRLKALYLNVNDPIRTELMSIVNYIKATSDDKKIWEDFKFYFEQNHQGFLQSLTQKHPVLTPIDLKYCCYLKMNMSNDDIKKILGINQESVRTHTYRLKQKLALPKEEDLRYYLRSVS